MEEEKYHEIGPNLRSAMYAAKEYLLGLNKEVSTSFGTFFRHFDFVVFGTPCKPHFLDYEKILSISAPNLHQIRQPLKIKRKIVLNN
jgi:hypothetical protein